MATHARNGNGAHSPADPLEVLRANVTALQVRARELDAATAEAQAALDRCVLDRPELAARAHARHEPEAVAQLKLLNTRALDYESVVLGLGTEAAKVHAELKGAEAALLEAESRHRLERAEQEAEALARQISDGLSLAAAKWAEFKATRDALYKAQAERCERLKIISGCLNEMASPAPRPPRESKSTIDAALARVTV